jgi:hypothetical protein
MLPAKAEEDHPTLEEVHALFDQWRKNKKRRDPIPVALWQAALSLTTQYSLNQVCRRLHLSYTTLKAHAQSRPLVPVTFNSATFIELDPVRATAEWVIEIEKPSGERAIIRGNCTVEELSRAFWQ